MTQSSAWPGRNPALQQGYDLVLVNRYVASVTRPITMQFDQLKRREFITLLGGAAGR
jgi:hypothetical protein